MGVRDREIRELYQKLGPALLAYARSLVDAGEAEAAPAEKTSKKPAKKATKKKPPPEPEEDGLRWVALDDGSALAFEEGKLVARNKKGKRWDWVAYLESGGDRYDSDPGYGSSRDGVDTNDATGE